MVKSQENSALSQSNCRIRRIPTAHACPVGMIFSPADVYSVNKSLTSTLPFFSVCHIVEHFIQSDCLQIPPYYRPDLSTISPFLSSSSPGKSKIKIKKNKNKKNLESESESYSSITSPFPSTISFPHYCGEDPIVCSKLPCSLAHLANVCLVLRNRLNRY